VNTSTEARITSLQRCVGHRDPMQAVTSARFIDGFGIEGDRHATSEGVRVKRQILLIDEESLEAFGLSIGDIRENVTTSGIDLGSLPDGQRLALGDEVLLDITEHCTACGRIDELRPGLRTEIEGRRGMLCLGSAGRRRQRRRLDTDRLHAGVRVAVRSYPTSPKYLQ